MKNRFLWVSLCLCLIFLSGCKKTEPKIGKIIIEEDNIVLLENESKKLNIKTENIDEKTLDYEYDKEGLKIVDGTITGLKKGTYLVSVKVKDDEKVEKGSFTVTVKEENKITIQNKEVTIYEKEEMKIPFTTNFTYDDKDIVWTSSNLDICTVDSTGLITGISKGTCNITLAINDTKEVIIVNVTEKEIKEFKVNLVDNMIFEKDYIFNLLITSEDYLDPINDFLITSSDETILKVEGLTLKAIKKGEVELTIMAKDDEDVRKDIKINVNDMDKPRLEYVDGENPIVKVNWNEDVDYLKGIKVMDNTDGDITSKVKVIGTVNNQVYGDYIIDYEVKDEAGHMLTFKRTFNVGWNYGVTFIGHAGSFYGLMNSEEAMLYALEVLHYQAIETDLKQTSDGVFVLSHDDTFGDYTIAQTPWSVLKDVEVTKSRSAGYPMQNGSVVNSPYTAKLCTLERYLDLCKEYKARPVIELKASNGITNSDQSRMEAFIDIVEKKDMLEDVILLGSQYNCLIWTRTHGYEMIECQYLVNSLESDAILQRCLDYDLDISINVTSTYSNSDEWLAKYEEKGIKISTYTFTQYVDYPEVQKWIDKGVQFVTCDWHIMSNLKLTPKEEQSGFTTHKVTFRAPDGSVLKEAVVKNGRTAAAPNPPEISGYEFIGWSKPITNVTEDLDVTAIYDAINYEITFDSNISVLKAVNYESKAAFIDELYSDMYNFFKENASSLPNCKITGNTVTITKNGQTATFSNKEELLAIDIYVFEKTVSNYMFKPVVRSADDTCVMLPDDNYFFNSNKYFEKYTYIDMWLINCINKQYTAYDKTYTPTSAGKIQIFFRMHQWAKGTTIVAFDDIPMKNEVTLLEGVNPVLPDKITYTVLDNVILPVATGDKTFLGWYLEKECINEVKEINTGTTKNMVLYAKWDLS